MATQYLHTFLIDCPNCKGGVVVCQVSDDAAREAADALLIIAHCRNCGEDFELPGWKATSHVVKEVLLGEPDLFRMQLEEARAERRRRYPKGPS
jgi:hypothetical protein